jgi:hypothetical protein
VGVLSAGQAQALLVTVNGQQWNVTTFTGTYDGNGSKFATVGNGGVMPWFGSSSLASSFATALSGALGLLNGPGNGIPAQPNFRVGPLFGYQRLPVGCLNECIAAASDSLGNPTNFKFTPSTGSYVWAQAAIDVPGPLPVFGAVAAFSFSRKLRRRIKTGTNSVSSTYSL